ncbi:MAG TPA: hydroxymethylglutaryl-CoA lyase [Baekduia sp.]
MSGTAVAIREVLPRDGFQDLDVRLPTDVKVAVIEALWGAGLRWIEITSMVHPKWVPQFADAEEVLAAVRELDGLTSSVFVPNRRGLDRALGAEATEVSLVVASTDALSRENFAMERDAALAEIVAVSEDAAAAGARVSVTIGGAFGCPFEGAVADETVRALVAAVAAAPVDSILLADTIGVARADDVARLVGAVADLVGDRPLGVHLHGGAGAVAGVLAGVGAGATLVDVSTTGLGGCPFVPNAPGNVSTEQTVAALHGAGIPTGVSEPALAAAATEIRRLLDEVTDHDTVPAA